MKLFLIKKIRVKNLKDLKTIYSGSARFMIVFPFSVCLQECQRLETILNLCTELGHVEREPAGSAASDLQKINKELEKLQVSDDDSVFSDSPSSTAPDSCFGAKAKDFQPAEEHQVCQRQQSGYRETASHSPAISLLSSAPSPSTHHRAKVRPCSFVSKPHKHLHPNAMLPQLWLLLPPVHISLIKLYHAQVLKTCCHKSILTSNEQAHESFCSLN